jgi:hypothetical protein
MAVIGKTGRWNVVKKCNVIEGTPPWRVARCKKPEYAAPADHPDFQNGLP